MGFNLNTSRKPEYSLNENMIDEVIQMYGIQCKWLYSEKINKDFVFNDFSHMKVGKEYKDVIVIPEDTSNWEGDLGYVGFGAFNQRTQILFISKSSLLDLYPNFLTETGARSNILNSLLITPASTILEVTDFEAYNININNMWAYNDDPSSYKLTVKVYTNNLADDGINDISTTVNLDEGEIFTEEEILDTSDIDTFFGSLDSLKEKQDEEGDKISSSGGPFGSLG